MNNLGLLVEEEGNDVYYNPDNPDQFNTLSKLLNKKRGVVNNSSIPGVDYPSTGNKFWEKKKRLNPKPKKKKKEKKSRSRSKFFTRVDETRVDEIQVDETLVELESQSEDEEDEDEKYMKLILKSLVYNHEMSHLSGIAETKNFKTYIFVVTILLILFYIGFVGVTFIQLFIPGFDVTSSFIFEALLIIGIEFLWIYQFTFLDADNKLSKLLKWILLVITLTIYYVMIFVLSSNLHVASMFIIHTITPFIFVGVIMFIYFSRQKLNELREISPKLNGSVILISNIIIFLSFNAFSGNPSIIIYFNVLSYITIIFQYIDEVVEMFEGITGVYDGLDYFTILFVLIRLIFIQEFILTTIIVSFKSYGFVIPFLKPFPNWYWVIDLPPSWFNFL